MCSWKVSLFSLVHSNILLRHASESSSQRPNWAMWSPRMTVKHWVLKTMGRISSRVMVSVKTRSCRWRSRWRTLGRGMMSETYCEQVELNALMHLRWPRPFCALEQRRFGQSSLSVNFTHLSTWCQPRVNGSPSADILPRCSSEPKVVALRTACARHQADEKGLGQDRHLFAL